MSERQFPILPSVRAELPDLPASVPWSLVAPHECQAQRNHYQTLERLAERHGLSWRELYFIITDQEWPRGRVEMTEREAAEFVCARVARAAQENSDAG